MFKSRNDDGIIGPTQVMPAAKAKAVVEAARELKLDRFTEYSSTPLVKPDPYAAILGHDSKACRLYGCGQCRALGVKNKTRGL
jgi:hypothetical protein